MKEGLGYHLADITRAVNAIREMLYAIRHSNNAAEVSRGIGNNTVIGHILKGEPSKAVEEYLKFGDDPLSYFMDIELRARFKLCRMSDEGVRFCNKDFSTGRSRGFVITEDDYARADVIISLVESGEYRPRTNFETVVSAPTEITSADTTDADDPHEKISKIATAVFFQSLEDDMGRLAMIDITRQVYTRNQYAMNVVREILQSVESELEEIATDAV